MEDAGRIRKRPSRATVQNLIRELAEPTGIGQEVAPPWFHPFPARMPLPLARNLIEKLTAPLDVVLDPMVGSGTTIAAARLAERVGLGFDLDPLAVKLGNVASTTYSSEEVDEAASRILERARRIRGSTPIFGDGESDFVEFWFPAEARTQLRALAGSISTEAQPKIRDLAWCVFSALIINKSKSVSYALDIARSRPHKKMDKPTPEPFPAWEKRFRLMSQRLRVLDSPSLAPSTCCRGDARNLALETGSVDFILTSPPYLSAIDYMRGHKFSLIWMGHQLEDLRQIRGTAVGSFRGLYAQDGLPHDLENRLHREINISSERARLRRYLSDLQRVLREAYRVLKPGKLAIFFLGPRLFPGQEEDCLQVVSQLTGQFEILEAAYRPLNPARRSLPLPARKTGHPLSKRMRSEAVIALRKPGDE